jgi:hypothetical protein
VMLNGFPLTVPSPFVVGEGVGVCCAVVVELPEVVVSVVAPLSPDEHAARTRHAEVATTRPARGWRGMPLR